jgi:hypothetical protein
MADDLSFQELRVRLKQNDHWFGVGVGAEPCNLHALPKEESIITIALYPDDTLKEKYRQRYFLCEPDPEAILSGPNCAQARHLWTEMLPRVTSGAHYDLLAGPAAWALSRLFRGGRTLVWTDGDVHWDDGAVDALKALFDATTDIVSWIARIRRSVGSCALFLDSNGDRFVEQFAACFLMVSLSCSNCFLATECCAEVYDIHHHDKVIACIPNAGVRYGVLLDLASAPDLFQDISGYD